MNDSILITIRNMIGPSASYDVFDTDLIININASISRLAQLGVGPRPPFKIQNDTATWADYLSDSSMLDDVKQYIYLKTRMVFDTPASGTVANAFKEQIDMLEWTLKEVARFGY